MQRGLRDEFRVGWRAPSHWDVWAGSQRLFAVRGDAPGQVLVRDEREPGRQTVLPFRSVGLAMAWIAEELMYEEST